jgi:hypothetical protein
VLARSLSFKILIHGLQCFSVWNRPKPNNESQLLTGLSTLLRHRILVNSPPSKWADVSPGKAQHVRVVSDRDILGLTAGIKFVVTAAINQVILRKIVVL